MHNDDVLYIFTGKFLNLGCAVFKLPIQSLIWEGFAHASSGPNFPSFLRTPGPFSEVGALVFAPLSTASLKQHPDYLNGDILIVLHTANVYKDSKWFNIFNSLLLYPPCP